MDWTIGKKCVPGCGSRRAGYAVSPVGRRPALGAALVLALLLGAAPAVRAGVTVSISDVTIASQAILPSSAPTAVIAINANATTPDDVARANDTLTVQLQGVRDFSATRDIVAVYLFRDSGVTPGSFSYDNFDLGGSTSIPPANGIYPVTETTCLGWYGPATLGGGGGNRLGAVAASLNFNTVLDTLVLPTNDTGSNAGADFFIVIQTSDALPHRAQFRVYAQYTPGTPPATPPAAVNVTTNTLTCEYYALNMTDRSGYHGWNWGMVHLGGVDGNPFDSTNSVMGINTPHLLFGLKLAGRSGLTASGNTTEYLTGLEMMFTGQGPAIFASHLIANYPDVSVWRDVNGDGRFQPTFELTSAGVAGTDSFVGPPNVTGGPVGSMRAHNAGRMTEFIDGVGAAGAYQASERVISLPETADNLVDFFVCLTTDPSHIWVTATPRYGDIFQMDLNDSPGGPRAVNFWYARQSGTDPITGAAKRVLTAILDADGNAEPVERTIVMSINGTSSPTGIIEADGFPAPIFNFNLANGIFQGSSESIEQIRVWFRGDNGFKPTHLMPLTDDQYSGIGLWWDNKLEGMTDQSNLLGQFDPPMGVGWLGQTQNGQALHSIVFTDTNLPLSTASLAWYNSGDHSPWSPFNDIGPDYYVWLKPKTPIALPTCDYDWQNFLNHGHGTVGNSRSFQDGSPVNARGPDLFVCVRANGFQNASYGTDWWERGMDFGGQMQAELRSPEDIVFTRTGTNASNDQFPQTSSQSLGTLPLAYNVLTTANNHPISPYTKTAALGINLVAPLGEQVSGLVNGATAITGVSSSWNGSLIFHAAGHGLAMGDNVTISGTGTYDGVFRVASATTGTFQVALPYVAEALTPANVNGAIPIIRVSDNGLGVARFEVPSHGLVAGDTAAVTGTTNYNRQYVVTSYDENTFLVSPRYTGAAGGQDLLFDARLNGNLIYNNVPGFGSVAVLGVVDVGDGAASFAAEGHGLVVGDVAVLTGAGGYSGSYIVTAAIPDGFQVTQQFLGAEEFPNVNNRRLTAVADAGDGTVVFTAPAHGLNIGGTAAINGTTNYNGTYAVTAVDGDDFQVSFTSSSNARITRLVVQVYDTGTKNFEISDLIDPTIQHPRQNHEGGGCGIAVYIDNPIQGQQGVFDPLYDIRMPMSAVPYTAGPPQLTMQLHLNFVPEQVIQDPSNMLVGTGGESDQASGPLPEAARVALGLLPAQATDAVFRSLDGSGVF
ncbi:MAG: hypothetical protein RBU25_04425, partial [Lentisphaeria bacterium]|nr:hypothetical protein [Lentisphaeria bacterium]